MKLTAAAIIWTAVAFAQPAKVVQFVRVDPAGSCNAAYITQNVTTGVLTGCVGGTWAAVGGTSSGGTVTSVAVTSCLPWITCSFGGTATVTPSLTIGAATAQTPGRVVGTCGAATSVALCALTAGDIPALAYEAPLTFSSGLNRSTNTITTDSTTQAFLRAGALTCGAATNGKMQVHTTPLQYCDNGATPTLRYSAYGDSSGVATNSLLLNGATFAAPGTIGGGTPGAATFTTVTATSFIGGAPLAPANGGVGTMTGAPFWLRFFGDGSEGAFSCLSGNCNVAGEHWYSSVVVAAGATVTDNSVNPLIIRSTGTCTIAGAVNARGDDSGVTAAGDVGGGGGGGGGGTGAGVVGSGTSLNGSPLITGGTVGGAGGGTGGDASGPVQQQRQRIIISNVVYPRGGGAGGAGGSTGGAGGLGGQVIVLACPTIDFQATGTIAVSGKNGVASPGINQGGGGGGGGGVVFLAAESYTNNAGSISVVGGTGGGCGAFTGCGAGGNGSAGWSAVLTIQ